MASKVCRKCWVRKFVEICPRNWPSSHRVWRLGKTGSASFLCVPWLSRLNKCDRRWLNRGFWVSDSPFWHSTKPVGYKHEIDSLHWRRVEGQNCVSSDKIAQIRPRIDRWKCKSRRDEKGMGFFGDRKQGTDKDRWYDDESGGHIKWLLLGWSPKVDPQNKRIWLQARLTPCWHPVLGWFARGTTGLR